MGTWVEKQGRGVWNEEIVLLDEGLGSRGMGGAVTFLCFVEGLAKGDGWRVCGEVGYMCIW